MKFKRTICLFLCALVMTGVLSFSTADVFASDLDYYYGEEETTTLSKEDAKEFANGKTNYYTVNQTVSQIIGLYSNISVYSSGELDYIKQGLSNNLSEDVYLTFYEIIKEYDLGAFVSNEKIEVKDNPDKKDSILANTVLKFENADVNMAVELMAFDNLGLQVVSSETSLVDDSKDVPAKKVPAETVKDTSLSSKLKEAGTNTIMGMGTVFVVLILISLIIYCFKYINKASNYFENKGTDANNTGAKPAASTESVAASTDEMDDLELVAVITAAIAASETTGEGFVVRSIRRR